MSSKSLHPNVVYMVECADSTSGLDQRGKVQTLPIVRSRCGRHVELSGPYRAVSVLESHRRSDEWSCVVCQGAIYGKR